MDEKNVLEKNEPLRKNHWLLKFPSDLEINECECDSAELPTCYFENGKKIWTPIMVSYNQFENCTVAKSLMKWCNSLEADKEKNKRDLEIDLLDGIGGLLTKWIIKGASIKSIHYGSLSYNDYGILTLQVDLNYDDAFIE